jgi:hypothetical protein
MTRTPGKAEPLKSAGATPVVCNLFDPVALTEAVVRFEPEAVWHMVTDLPDRLDDLAGFAARNDRVRTEGTRNVVAAFAAAGARHLLAQSIAWRPEGREPALDEHERKVLQAGGVLVRYGQFYGPGTFYPDRLPPPPRLHLEAAAARTVGLISAPSGIVTMTDGTATDESTAAERQV